MTYTLTIAPATTFHGITATIEAESYEHAQEIKAMFPKAHAFHAQMVYSNGGNTFRVQSQTRLEATAVNGGTNEAGIKRIAAIQAKAAKLGMTVVDDR